MSTVSTPIDYHTELIDGLERQKPLPKRPHTIIQVFLIQWFGRELSVEYDVGSEQNVICGVDRLVPDVTVASANARYENGDLADPPILAVEILSPGQVVSDLFDKCNRLLNSGARTCWVIWPEQRRAWICTQSQFTEIGAGDLSVELGIEGRPASFLRLPLTELWAELTRRGF